MIYKIFKIWIKFNNSPYKVIIYIFYWIIVKAKYDKFQDKHNIDFNKVIKVINSNLPDDICLYSCKLVT